MTPEIEALCARLEAFEGSDALGNGDFRLMSEAAAKLREMAGALAWYAEQTAGSRKLSAAGDPFRHALDADGGLRARRAISDAGDGGK